MLSLCDPDFLRRDCLLLPRERVLHVDQSMTRQHKFRHVILMTKVTITSIASGSRWIMSTCPYCLATQIIISDHYRFDRLFMTHHEEITWLNTLMNWSIYGNLVTPYDVIYHILYYAENVPLGLIWNTSLVTPYDIIEVSLLEQALACCQTAPSYSPWVNSVLLYVRPEVFHDVSLMYDKGPSGICLMYDKFPSVFAWCTSRFVHKAEFSYIGRNGVHTLCDCRQPSDTLRNNDVVIMSKRRHFDVITSKWRRFDVITTLSLHHVFRGSNTTSIEISMNLPSIWAVKD